MIDWVSYLIEETSRQLEIDRPTQKKDVRKYEHQYIESVGKRVREIKREILWERDRDINRDRGKEIKMEKDDKRTEKGRKRRMLEEKSAESGKSNRI